MKNRERNEILIGDTVLETARDEGSDGKDHPGDAVYYGPSRHREPDGKAYGNIAADAFEECLQLTER